MYVKKGTWYCMRLWDALLYNIFQTESNVMVDSGQIIECNQMYILLLIIPPPPPYFNATDVLFFKPLN